MDLRRTILLLRSFPKLLLIISTITITTGFKLKQNGCLPLNSGKHPCLNLNYSFFIQCPENWVHISSVWSIGGFFVYLRYSRTAVLALALINQVLSSLGKPLLPIESAQLEQLISTGFTTVSALVNWWFNNSFTKEAIQADAEFERLRKSVK